MRNREIADLIFLNSIAPGHSLKHSIYSFKDFLVKNYGIPDGYDRQLFYKYAWGEYCERGRIDFCRCEEQCQIWSSHLHFLERRLLAGHLFHLPINVFIVKNANGHTINSGGVPPTFKNTIYGRKHAIERASYSSDQVISAVMRVTLRYGHYFHNHAFKTYLKGAY